MKKLLFLIIACVVMTLVSCNKHPPVVTSTEGTNDTEITTQDYTQVEYITILSPDDFYDREKNSIPSDEDIKKIEAGMRLTEVVELIGSPPSGGNFSSTITPIWYTAEGHTAVIMNLKPIDGAPQKPTDKPALYEYYLNYCDVGSLVLLDSDVFQMNADVIWGVSLPEFQITDTTVSVN